MTTTTSDLNRLRVLLTVQPSTGHLHPLMPVANALAAAGHEVAFCSAPAFRGEVEAYGFPYFDAGLDWVTSDQSTWQAFPPMPPPGPEFGAFSVTMFADITTRRMVPDLLAIARQWAPDLVIRESMEYGGCLAAECLGLPHASIAGNAYSAVDLPTVHHFAGNRRLVAEPLARHRAEFGLPPDPDVLMPFRSLHLAFMPPTWEGRDAPRPPHTHFLRHTNTAPPGGKLPAWVDELPKRPTVYASLGTVFNKTSGILEAIIAALGDEPVNVVVAIGRDQDPVRFGPQPPHVHLEPSVAQTLLLPHCDLFITHGGFNSVKEALSVGVPMVVVPITADQPYSAGRCAALGVARVIDADHRTPEAIGEATRQVLVDPSYRAKARQVQGEMLALPGLEHAVELLESLAAKGS